jgi:hypothetical protein
MSSVKLQGNASGTGAITIASPNTNNNYTLTLLAASTTIVGNDTTQTLTNKTLTSPAISGAVMTTMASSVITSGTTQASTSGSTIDFTSIPSWVKRITVMFNGVSMSSTNDVLVQLGVSGTPVATGYVSSSGRISGTSASGSANTTGFNVYFNGAGLTLDGAMVITTLGSNIWVASHAIAYNGGSATGGGSVTLGGTLNMIRIKSAGADTFDAGSINILYE